MKSEETSNHALPRVGLDFGKPALLRSPRYLWYRLYPLPRVLSDWGTRFHHSGPVVRRSNGRLDGH